MAEYEERYKIIFDMDATGGGVNINVQGGGQVAIPSGVSTSSAGGAGGLLGAIANSVANIAAGKVGVRIGSRSVSLAEKVRNFRRSLGNGDPNTGRFGRQMFESENDFRRFSNRQRAFPTTVGSRKSLSKALQEWHSVKNKSSIGKGLGNPLPPKYMGYKMDPALENPGLPSGISYQMKTPAKQENVQFSTLIGEYQLVRPVYMTRTAEYTRK